MFSYFTTSNLYLAAFVIFLFTLMAVMYLFLELYNLKSMQQKSEEIHQHLEAHLMNLLVDPYNEPMSKYVYDINLLISGSTAYRQMVADNLIDMKKSLSGEAGDALIQLFQSLRLDQFALTKLRSSSPATVAKGIYELYQMKQVQHAAAIEPFVKSKRQFESREALMAVIALEGFAGLHFLTEYRFSISEWKQLKIVDLLAGNPNVELDGAVRWLNSENESVRQLALKLIAAWQQFPFHDQVVQCLQDPADAVKIQAIKTLKVIGNQDTTRILSELYNLMNKEQKIEILDSFRYLSSMNDLDFLTETVDLENGSLKCAAMKALLTMVPAQYQILTKKYAANAEALSMLQHIKYQFGL